MLFNISHTIWPSNYFQSIFVAALLACEKDSMVIYHKIFVMIVNLNLYKNYRKK